jgi:hypothetical protein
MERRGLLRPAAAALHLVEGHREEPQQDAVLEVNDELSVSHGFHGFPQTAAARLLHALNERTRKQISCLGSPIV